MGPGRRPRPGPVGRANRRSPRLRERQTMTFPSRRRPGIHQAPAPGPGPGPARGDPAHALFLRRAPGRAVGPAGESRRRRARPAPHARQREYLIIQPLVPAAPDPLITQAAQAVKTLDDLVLRATDGERGGAAGGERGRGSGTTGATTRLREVAERRGGT